jgi:Fur family ferric uptake transcriptional regulator
MQPSAEELIAGLRGAGLRITEARRLICKTLAEAPGDHLSAGEIVARVGGAGIDTSTVYRTLDVLEELGYVHHIHLGHGAGAYHVAPEASHHHLVCDRCGKTIDVPLDELRTAIAFVTEPHGFVPDDTHFAIVGRCGECAEEGR